MTSSSLHMRLEKRLMVPPPAPHANARACTYARARGCARARARACARARARAHARARARADSLLPLRCTLSLQVALALVLDVTCFTKALQANMPRAQIQTVSANGQHRHRVCCSAIVEVLVCEQRRAESLHDRLVMIQIPDVAGAAATGRNSSSSSSSVAVYTAAWAGLGQPRQGLAEPEDGFNLVAESVRCAAAKDTANVLVGRALEH